MRIFSLKKGDLVVKSITDYIKKNEIRSGVIIALGAVTKAELMLYNLNTKKYISKMLSGVLEVGNLIAVIGQDPEGNAHIHPHAVLSNENFDTFTGHLKEATVGATLEVVIFKSDQKLQRYFDSEIGLNLIK